MLLYFTALQNEINFCSILVTKMIGLGTFFSLKGSKLSLVVEIVSDALMRLPARLPTYQHPCQGKLQFEEFWYSLKLACTNCRVKGCLDN